MTKKKKALYYSCDRYGNERYPSEILGNAGSSSEAINLVEVEKEITSDSQCEICESQTDIFNEITGIGVYIVQIDSGGLLSSKSITDYDYYCYECC